MINTLNAMKHSPIRNYVIPGLTSWMIGEKASDGSCVRLFECERNHVEPIVPHSHRFDFACHVLEGVVTNRLWRKDDEPTGKRHFDAYTAISLKYLGEVGNYSRSVIGVDEWCYQDRTYKAGERYSMKANEIHSIYFSKGAKVLFFEGPTETDSSVVLKPFVDGETIDTFKVESWMFKKEVSDE